MTVVGSEIFMVTEVMLGVTVSIVDARQVFITKESKVT